MAEIHDLVARVPLISSTSRGPIVNLVGWITMVTMILAVSTVLVSKMIVLRKLGWTDLIIALAMVRL
jgi:ABC-type glycerol-3-phosphate transport system permease component